MTAARALQLDDWVVHRPNVVRSVAARVPGIDAEEAASRALEKMVRLAATGTTIEDPAPYWRRAAVNEAISMTREAGRANAVEDDTLDRLTPPVAGAELDAERHADVTMLRTALSDLADDDRQILLERHVHDRAVTDIATNLGARPHAVTMRLRRAEERLAGAFAAAHAQGVNEPECRTTRAAMHDYLKDRLLPRRRTRFEVHMDGCAECTRAFVDVREVSWMLRDLGQHAIAGALATGALGAAVGGAAAGAAGGAAGRVEQAQVERARRGQAHRARSARRRPRSPRVSSRRWPSEVASPRSSPIRPLIRLRPSPLRFRVQVGAVLAVPVAVLRVLGMEQVGPATQAVAASAQRTVRTARPKAEPGRTPHPRPTAPRATALRVAVLRVAVPAVPGRPTTRSPISARR